MSQTEPRRSLLSQEIAFDAIYAVFSHRWWWLALTMMVGGILGLLLSIALPPGYQATASLGIGIDYGRTHPLDREAERQVLLQVQDLLLSDGVMATALEFTERSSGEVTGIDSAADLRRQVRLDRFEGRWDLSVFSSNPAQAAALANGWSGASIEAVQAALEAAWRALDLQQEIYEVGCQLERSEDIEAAVLRCQQGEPEGADQLHQSLLRAVRDSHGLLPALSYAQLRQAVVPETPVYRSRSWLILAGLMIGLALSLVAVLATPTSTVMREEELAGVDHSEIE